jgi:hypothetical protein
VKKGERKEGGREEGRKEEKKDMEGMRDPLNF